jgi:peptidoglycan/LPS O-acetylase OafA/YrhL
VAVGSGSSFTVGPISDMKNSGSADSHVIRYRADVDGLRAIAVISVVLFHLFQSAIPGGYLGVDMFFVLSGYLITSIVWREVRFKRISAVRASTLPGRI